MFVEDLTEIQIHQFRIMTPLTIKGRPVPYRIYCAGKFYEDPRGSSPYIMFLKDFSCSLSYANNEDKQALNRHYIKFMRKEFKDRNYDDELSIHVFKKYYDNENSL